MNAPLRFVVSHAAGRPPLHRCAEIGRLGRSIVRAVPGNGGDSRSPACVVARPPAAAAIVVTSPGRQEHREGPQVALAREQVRRWSCRMSELYFRKLATDRLASAGGLKIATGWPRRTHRPPSALPDWPGAAAPGRCTRSPKACQVRVGGRRSQPASSFVTRMPVDHPGACGLGRQGEERHASAPSPATEIRFSASCVMNPPPAVSLAGITDNP